MVFKLRYSRPAYTKVVKDNNGTEQNRRTYIDSPLDGGRHNEILWSTGIQANRFKCFETFLIELVRSQGQQQRLPSIIRMQGGYACVQAMVETFARAHFRRLLPMSLSSGLHLGSIISPEPAGPFLKECDLEVEPSTTHIEIVTGRGCVLN
uniref:Uncharacterized protein n=1 Tax=Glossina pallidipes TaxID=7398 RepID=A0A1A9ZCL3_GLOPL